MSWATEIDLAFEGSREQAQEELNRMAQTLIEAGYNVVGWDVLDWFDPKEAAE